MPADIVIAQKVVPVEIVSRIQPATRLPHGGTVQLIFPRAWQDFRLGSISRRASHLLLLERYRDWHGIISPEAKGRCRHAAAALAR